MIDRKHIREGAVVRFWAENSDRIAVVQTTPRPTSKTVEVGAFRYKNGRMSSPRRIDIQCITAVVKCALPEHIACLPYWDLYVRRHGDTDATRRQLDKFVGEALKAEGIGGVIVGLSPGGVLWVAWALTSVESMTTRLAAAWDKAVAA